MPTTIINTDITNSTTTVTDGDNIIVQAGVTLSNDTTRVFYGTTVELFRLFNSGIIHGATGDLIIVSDSSISGSFDYIIHNFATGMIMGENTALFLSGQSSGGDEVFRLTNDGFMSSEEFTTVGLRNIDNIFVTNSGTIYAAGQGGTYAQHGGIGVQSGTNIDVSNTATGSIITASVAAGTTSTDIARSAAISFLYSEIGANARIFNAGLVQGATHAIYSDADVFSLENTGTIDGMIYTLGTEAFVINDGLMTGGIAMSATDLEFTNSDRVTGDMLFTLTGGATFLNTALGQLRGDIEFAAASGVSVVFDNMGLIDGDLTFGDGDDVYNGANGGLLTVSSEVFLGGGNDGYLGGAGRDRVYDGSGDDTIEGNGGNDSFRAGTGANHYDGGDGFDYLSYYDFSTWVRIDLTSGSTAGGGAGNAAGNDSFINIEAVGGTNGGDDYLYGDAGQNTLYGWGGNDHLYGRSGNDRLLGGEGDDFFDGGAGTDQLYGGGGADQFEFDRGEGDDVVHDFENNIDRLRFDNFSYLTTAADALTYATQIGSDVLFDFGADGTVLVLGVTTGQLANDIDIV